MNATAKLNEIASLDPAFAIYITEQRDAGKSDAEIYEQFLRVTDYIAKAA